MGAVDLTNKLKEQHACFSKDVPTQPITAQATMKPCSLMIQDIGSVANGRKVATAVYGNGNKENDLSVMDILPKNPNSNAAWDQDTALVSGDYGIEVPLVENRDYLLRDLAITDSIAIVKGIDIMVLGTGNLNVIAQATLGTKVKAHIFLAQESFTLTTTETKHRYTYKGVRGILIADADTV